MARRVDLSVAQAAAIAGVSQAVVRKWISRGNVRRNAYGRIDGESLVTYLDGRGDWGQHKLPHAALPPGLARKLREWRARRN